MKSLVELTMLGISAVLLFLFTLGVIYTIWYLIIYGIFWAFGPTVFGYTFSYKIVFGYWLISIILNLIFKITK